MAFQWVQLSRKQQMVMTWWIQRPDARGIICDGAIRSGKTVIMAISFLVWSMSTYDHQAFGMCGKTIGSFRRNVLSPLKQMVAARPGWTLEEHRTDGYFKIFANGHENTYYMFGGRDESSQDLVQGVTLAGCFFDEVALMPESFVNQATARCSVSGSKLWFNCNPRGPAHWFYRKWIMRYKRQKLLYLHFTMDDNLSLDEEIKERYRSMYTGVFYERYILGLWRKAEGLVYPMFSVDKNTITDNPYEISYRNKYFVSVDYGTVNPFAAGLFEYNPKTQALTLIREVYYIGREGARMDNEGYYKLLVDMTEDVRIDRLIIDPSAAGMIETINKYRKYSVYRADNAVLDGIQEVTKYINLGKLRIHRNCEHTIEEFQEYSWDTDSAKEAVIKEDDHMMDAIRYMVMYIAHNENRWRV